MTPKPWRKMSATVEPTRPIQFREPCDGPKPAVFSEGSRGEYETRARKRRPAQTNSKKPTSSLSRRLSVGVKTRARNFMRRTVVRQSTVNYEGTSPVKQPDLPREPA